MPAALRHQFAGSHIALIIDGDDAKTAYLKAAEGGMFKAATTEEPSAGYHIRGKHASVRELDPLSFEFGFSGAKWALALMKKICKAPSEAHVPFDGQIIHADSNFKAQYSYEFSRARITEFTLPKLDAKGKDHATVKMKAQPETCVFKIEEGAKLHPGKIDKQKQLITSAFHLTVGNATVDAVSIEALTVKVGSKAYQTGGVHMPQYTATGKLEMPKLSFTVPMGKAKSLVTWFQNAIGKEVGLVDGASFERDVMIEYLDPTRNKVLYTIDLKGCGPETLSVVKGSNEASAMMKFDCYVTSIQLEASGEGII
jgi:hypothetical protein